MSKRQEIKKVITENGKLVFQNSKFKREIQEHLIKYGISNGKIERVLSSPESIEDMDMRELLLILEQFYVKTGNISFDPSNWFQEVEIKRARQYHASMSKDDVLELPLTINNVMRVQSNVFQTIISVKDIAEWMRDELLSYNYDIQRQPKRKGKKDNIIFRPTVYQKNVKEIKDLLSKGQLMVSTLVFNAGVGTSDVDEELTYDSSNSSLTINRGTIIDILDGFHRCLASVKAYNENPEIEFNFILELTNYTTREAQQRQAQHAKATPIPKTRIIEMEANRYADTVVQMLRSDSELRGRITSSTQITRSQGDLVSYNVLSNAIDREFKMSSRVEAREVAKYLSSFFEYLIGENYDEFSDENDAKESLMSYNKVFSGYIALASSMKDLGIPESNVNKILKEVDFSRENPLWRNLGVLDSDFLIAKKTDYIKMSDYFKSIVNK